MPELNAQEQAKVDKLTELLIPSLEKKLIAKFEASKEQDKLTDDSLEILRSDVGEVQKELSVLKELLKEPVNNKNITPESDTEVDLKKWPTMGHYLKALAKYAINNKDVDSRLVRSNFLDVVKAGPTAGHLEEDTDSYGGFLVPEEQRMEVMMLALENAIMRPNAFVIPMRSDTLKIPRVQDSSHASSVFGGVVAYWTEEAASLSETNPAFAQMVLRAHKLTGYTYCSNELLNDNAVGLETLLKRLFPDAITYYEDTAFLTGTGSGQPLGISGAGCLIAVSRNTASHFYFQDVVGMYARMLPSSLNRAIWIISPAVLPELLSMESPAAQAATAGGHLAWLPTSEGLKSNPLPMRLLGRPVYISEKISTLGTAGDVYFIDPSYYIIGDRQALEFEASTHYRFANDEITYRFKQRCDGQPWLSSTLTPKNSGNTLSPIVQLS